RTTAVKQNGARTTAVKQKGASTTPVKQKGASTTPVEQKGALTAALQEGQPDAGDGMTILAKLRLSLNSEQRDDFEALLMHQSVALRQGLPIPGLYIPPLGAPSDTSRGGGRKNPFLCTCGRRDPNIVVNLRKKLRDTQRNSKDTEEELARATNLTELLRRQVDELKEDAKSTLESFKCRLGIVHALNSRASHAFFLVHSDHKVFSKAERALLEWKVFLQVMDGTWRCSQEREEEFQDLGTRVRRYVLNLYPWAQTSVMEKCGILRLLRNKPVHTLGEIEAMKKELRRWIAEIQMSVNIKELALFDKMLDEATEASTQTDI
ncbi:hypothetical protein KIPB_000328, partial [Kipferlia bialata]